MPERRRRHALMFSSLVGPAFLVYTGRDPSTEDGGAEGGGIALLRTRHARCTSTRGLFYSLGYVPLHRGTSSKDSQSSAEL